MHTAEDLAKAYVETIYGPANGWGQYCHPTLGRSDYVMLRIFKLVGKDKGNLLIDREMDNYKRRHRQRANG